ncbi:carotenoid oxygenase [Fusarium albosuccineum]|uniref:Carotenoid oxygenase n=1 Tax=Fusarium albosuccineum TaxID=1237068 RepID=A0A8H4LJP1_9HYPO|nr:carotenoid oxygenase [Fusarium albosuccineum]
MTDSHITLQTSSASIRGVVDQRFGPSVWHFRGIPYGRIEKRFAKPEYVPLGRNEVDGTEFGPQCPQPHVDVGHLLRLPEKFSNPKIDQDEFRCLNLNVSRPKDSDIADKGLLPVLVWIHGGSQCVTFASAASSVCDPTHFVAHSVDAAKPIIIVTFNYRLNIFAFGYGSGEKNLALQDQRIALEWVSKNISEFGGDPKQITLAGESAGAVYAHAHILSTRSAGLVQQAVLASGSLHLSPPQPASVGKNLLDRITSELASRKDTLHGGSAESLVKALVNCKINSMWIQQEADLDGWEDRSEQVDALMVSDVEYESAIWRNGVEQKAPEEIMEVVSTFYPDSWQKLAELYNIHRDRPVSSKLGALDIINDTRFAFPAFDISERWRKEDNNRIYQYIVDEANPWQASSRAHHAVDLIFLFGGVDLSFKPGAERVGGHMREAWMIFMTRLSHYTIMAGHPFATSFEADTGYVDGKRVKNGSKYPNTPFFKGALQPSRIECDVVELETSGNIPKDINGTFFRVQPDPRFPPMYEEDVNFSGDGMVSAIIFNNGHVDFKQRYVQTDRYQAEAKHREAMFGKYRNPFTDNEMVKGIIRTVSNTNVYFWRGVMLASKEDGPPYAMDPSTLGTLGRYDFEGQMKAPCFTAHPRFDPDTGEMVAFAYEAGGDGHDASCDIVVWTFEPENGKKTEERWYKAPFCGMIHDCALTENYLVLPMTPLKCDLDRLKKGGNHWAWDPNEDQYYGIVPRRPGKDDDIIWLRADNGFHGHIAGAYEDENGHIVCDLTVADGNVFFWWPPDNGADGAHALQAKARQKLISDTFRWVFDPTSKTNTRVTPFKKYGTNGEFSRIDDRFTTKRYSHFWQLQMDPTRPYDIAKCGPPAGGLWNVMGHFNWDTETKDVYFAGPTCTFQEPVFIPKAGSQAEGDGYLVALLNHLDVQRNDILIFDALNVSQGPIGVVHLPLRLRMGLHGNFVDHNEIEEWQKRRSEIGDVGPAKVATDPLPWQLA